MLVFIVIHFVFVTDCSVEIKVLLIVAEPGVAMDHMNTQYGIVIIPSHDANIFILAILAADMMV